MLFYLLGTLIGAACLIAAAVAVWGSPGRSHLAGALFAVGGSIFLGFGMVFLFDAVDAVRRNRLASGRGLIARWTVGEGRWQAFCRLNHALNAQDADRNFHIPDAHEPRPGGVDVLAGKDAALLDGYFQRLPRGGSTVVTGLQWCDGPPAFIEFRLEISTGEPGTATCAFRLPTAEGGEAAAREVYNHYKALLVTSGATP